ncbi:hypothetical protein [Chitinophaga qingshengii]|uniref:Alpha/beta hydrolase n=1 Tax=Chitinophaga qingshengii TaxID=1569794 RepID=A0ABR7TWE2_9BACT|nr:hypothetical protein [Chitinophaga qingshengii]MBC9934801.1 hypothetical protein [Chitinophaga qingshengii]
MPLSEQFATGYVISRDGTRIGYRQTGSGPGVAKKQTGDEVTYKALIPTMHYDLILVGESPQLIDQCKDIKAAMLLMGGTRSQRYLKLALDTLSTALPAAKRITFRCLGHTAADNDNSPEKVAKALMDFFQ